MNDTGSIDVNFEVEAQGSDANSTMALYKSTTSLQSELASGGLSFSIGGQSLTAPEQNVTIAVIDVTPNINQTYPFQFQVMPAINQTYPFHFQVMHTVNLPFSIFNNAHHQATLFHFTPE